MSEAYVRDMQPTTKAGAKQEMTLADFVEKAGSDTVRQLFREVNAGTYSACHCNFYEQTGIWIPELVPIFQKMDAMMALRGGAIRPR
jgi:hypothetical protein